ncbi:MAG: single-stranded DNA-binding protein [Bdellovibrionales bacterium]|nr:single-stranded DNA-binding protein [Bdellovibrionales bacterium]
MGVNKVILLGNLGRDPELRYTNNQMAICRLTVATGERRKDASGNWTEHTEWHNVVTFGKTAENCSNFLKKGRQVFVEGRIQTRKWQDKEGKDRYSTEVVASAVQFIGGRSEGSGRRVEVESHSDAGQDMLDSLPSADQLGGDSDTAAVFDDDDIPF